MNEIKFNKYKTRGSDYHWRAVDKKNIYQFNAFLYTRYLMISEAIDEIIKKRDNKQIKIIDFGCGDGVQINFIKKNLNKLFPELTLEIYGIDLSEEALEVAKKKNSDAIFNKYSVYDTYFADNTFDIAISTDVIEHLKEPNKMISEITRITKQNGNIIISTPIKFTEKPQDNMHVQEYFMNNFTELFVNKNLQIIKHTQSHSLFYCALYNKHISIFKHKVLFFRLILNLIIIILHINPFLKSEVIIPDITTYQLLILQKNK